MRTIILRFSDAELEGGPVDTVEAHTAIIASSKQRHTWWGWWKKKHEASRSEILGYVGDFSRAQKLNVGLLNRKGVERYYVAQCSDCVTNNGEPLRSPDPALTPAYYAEQSFPAWFKFTRIDEVTRADFIRQFGDVPSLDPTLYEVVGDERGIRVIPSRTWNLRPINAPGEAILHTSDIHFGEGHGFPTSRPHPGAGVDSRPLSETLIEALRQIPVPIGTVVVSGDFVSKGDGNSYPLASAFLDDLANGLGLTRANFVISPGNHDLWTIDVEHPTRTYEHELPFRTFLESFHHERVQDLERITKIVTPSGLSLIFVTLNSARIRADNLKEYGYVSNHRYETLLIYLKNYLLSADKNEPTIVFAVLHHHIMPAVPVDIPDGKRPVSLTLDAGELIEQFCSAGVGYVLHGHQHMPYVGQASKIDSKKYNWNIGTNGLFVLGSGSTGAKRDWIPEEIGKNTFSVYFPKEGHLQVQVFEFSPRLKPTKFWSGFLPLQNFHDLVPNAL